MLKTIEKNVLFYYNLLHVMGESTYSPGYMRFFRITVEKHCFLLYYAYMWGHR